MNGTNIQPVARTKKKQQSGKRLIPLRDLAHTVATSTRLDQRDLLTHSEEKASDSLDDVSTIFLESRESNECSLQGQPRSNNTTSLSSDLSSNSAGDRGKSRQRGTSQDSLSDYKQNFPFEPPRQANTKLQMKMSSVQHALGAKRAATSNVPPWNQTDSHT